jgi:hypothetical protein
VRFIRDSFSGDDQILRWGAIDGIGQQRAQSRQQRVHLLRIENGRFDEQRRASAGNQQRIGFDQVFDLVEIVLRVVLRHIRSQRTGGARFDPPRRVGVGPAQRPRDAAQSGQQ